MVFLLAAALLYQSCQDYETPTKKIADDSNELIVEVLASEPEIINPMTMAVDDKGSIYVSLSHTYRYGKDGAPYDSISNPIKKIKLDERGEVQSIITIAEGFQDPVMGIAIDDDQLFVTNLNQILALKLNESDQVIHQEVLVHDTTTPWNPFGMYRIIIGPDDKLWFSVADRPSSDPVVLTGTDGKTVRLSGQSGGILRCNRDGSDLERIVDGLRAPYGFEVDPWGHLWVISNGEGSPNIYFDAIYGMDYGYHSRDVTYNWLAGKTALSPPVADMGPGANTATMAYRSAHFPKEYVNDIYMSNWGNHGFNPSNRVIRKFSESDLARIRSSEPTVTGQPFFAPANDSLFRPTDIKLRPEGTMLISDWQGRDDESNRLGKIYRISSNNHERKKEPHDIPFLEGVLARDNPIELLDHPNHWLRRQAVKHWVRSDSIPDHLFRQLLTGGSPLASANALWILTQRPDPSVVKMMEAALSHEDARVRAMAIRQLRQKYGLGLVRNNKIDNAEKISSKKHQYLDRLMKPLLTDPSVEVRIDAALTLSYPKDIVSGLLQASELAQDKFSMYRIGFELGKFCNRAELDQIPLLFGDRQQFIVGVCGETILHQRPEWGHVVEKWNIPALKYKDLADQLVDQVRTGKKIELSKEKRIIINRLNEYPSIDTVFQDFIAACLFEEHALLQRAALRAVRNGPFYRNDIVQRTKSIWENSRDSLVKMEALYTAGSFPKHVQCLDWELILDDSSENIVITALRVLKDYASRIRSTDQLEATLRSIYQQHPKWKEEVLLTSEALGYTAIGSESEYKRKTDIQEVYGGIKRQLHQASAARGELVFNSKAAACSTCHATDENIGFDKIGPNLSAIAVATQPQYLMESILEPGKVIKTGYRMERIETTSDEIWIGISENSADEVLIHTFGDTLIRINQSEIKNRNKLEASIMPGGYEARMTHLELSDLVKYLMSLKNDGLNN